VRPPRSSTGEHPPAPSATELAALLDAWAPLGPAPLCPELSVFQARSLLGIWQAAEALAGRLLPAPFWAYAWAAGCALARLLLDEPERVRGRRVLDVGCGSGVAALAAARAGAAQVVANDVDPWALATLAIAAGRQGLRVEPLRADLTLAAAGALGFEVVLCGDLAYERAQAAPQRALLRACLEHGARVLLADAERAYFDAEGLLLLRELRVAVPKDLEGVEQRTARVYELR
jgi:predicted nicotinamide N-methyase